MASQTKVVFVAFSQDERKKEQTLRIKLEKELEKADKTFNKLKGEDFFCEENALKAKRNELKSFLLCV